MYVRSGGSSLLLKYQETKGWQKRHAWPDGIRERAWEGAQPAGCPAPDFLRLPLGICLQNALPTGQNFDFSETFINQHATD